MNVENFDPFSKLQSKSSTYTLLLDIYHYASIAGCEHCLSKWNIHHALKMSKANAKTLP